MEIIRGKGVSGGVVRGKTKRIRTAWPYVPAADGSTAKPAEELLKFRDACEKVSGELETLYRKTMDAIGQKEAEIFSIHQMMLADADFTDAVEEKMADGMNAVAAVLAVGQTLAAQFSAMDNPYMQARAQDVESVSRRVADVLCGKEPVSIRTDTPVILIADDLTPAQTMELDLSMILGFVTEKGSTNSHTAILARMLDIPAVAAAGPIPEETDARDAILDGREGTLVLDPDSETITVYAEKAEQDRRRKASLEALRGQTCTRPDGTPIHIYANAGSMEDAAAAEKGDAEGIGLFRSEFLFMQYGRSPTEEEQYTVYRDVLSRMQGRETIIRTLDAGADKQIGWLTGDLRESNPALGLRAVRLCLRFPELFVTQLRALYRAASHGRIRAMIPMITLPSELEQVRSIAGKVRQELAQEGIPHDPDMPIGIMIETPSAALYAEELAELADFFSIGTNDLIQYTMAADRENPDVAYLTETLPESVKRLIRMSVSAAVQAGIPVGVCGEIAGDSRVIPFLLEVGVTKLSVSPGQVLRVRDAVKQALTEQK